MCKSIMVVDDADLWNKMMYDILTKLGYSCITAQNAKDAIELYSMNKPDLILMDIVMPDKDGIACAKEIICKDKSAKIIIVSAVIIPKYVISALDVGVWDIVHKFSFNPACEDNILFNKIKEVLLRSQNQKYDINFIENKFSYADSRTFLSSVQLEEVLAISKK